MFIGMILNMGIIQLERIHDNWSTCATCNYVMRPFPSNLWHVSEIDARLNKARYNYSSICYTHLKSNYTPDKQVAADEAVISFRGRVSFR